MVIDRGTLSEIQTVVGSASELWHDNKQMEVVKAEQLCKHPNNTDSQCKEPLTGVG